LRYLVLPERPAGTEDLSEDELAGLVTRDAMVGVSKVPPPGAKALTASMIWVGCKVWVLFYTKRTSPFSMPRGKGA